MAEQHTARPIVAVAREWGPLVGLSLSLMIIMMLWIGCTHRAENAAPGRYQMLLDNDGRVIVLDTATGETWVRGNHSQRPLP